MEAVVVSVSSDPGHNFSKKIWDAITLITGLGVEGDAHLGERVQHRTLVRKDPTLPNLRQVHLIHSELFEELRQGGFNIAAADLGENILTCGIDLLGLPLGTRLHIGDAATVEITGLRNPCRQLEAFRQGLVAAVFYKDERGELVRKAGIMGIVAAGGVVRPGDPIRVEMPSGERRPLPRL